MKYFFATLFILTVWTIGYMIPRTDIFLFLGSYTLLFGVFLFIFKKVKSHHSFLFYVSVAIIARVGLLLAWPGLSDDLYRFFWDGVVSNSGYSPYAMTPREMVDGGVVSQYLINEIFPRLNSQDYYSIYPPFSQLLYRISTFFTSENLYLSAVGMRVFIIAADIGIIYLLMKLLPALKYNQKNALLYALNPLVILEFSGNLHAEVIMLFFFLLSFWWLLKGKWVLFSIFFAFGILTKLTILLLFPLLLKRLGLRRFLYSFMIIVLVVAIPYIYMGIWDYLFHYIESVRLYFQKFEFNASFYYFFRWIGYHWKGYNLIYWIGPFLSVLAVGGYFFMYILQYLNDKGVLVRALFVFTILLFSSTTVHPWYLVFLIAFCLFSHYRYPIVWSFLIIFSYTSYVSEPYKENLLIVFAEYFLLGIILLIEFNFVPAKWYHYFFEKPM